MKPKKLNQLVAGLCVSHVATDAGAVVIFFTDKSSLVVECDAKGLAATFEPRDAHAKHADRPTLRQREYLDFIKRYMARVGIGPAETDIQRHFLVSAPSVNQMVKTLERRGFITRQRDIYGRVVPRSIRIVDPQ